MFDITKVTKDISNILLSNNYSSFDWKQSPVENDTLAVLDLSKYSDNLCAGLLFSNDSLKLVSVSSDTGIIGKTLVDFDRCKLADEDSAGYFVAYIFKSYLEDKEKDTLEDYLKVFVKAKEDRFLTYTFGFHYYLLMECIVKALESYGNKVSSYNIEEIGTPFGKNRPCGIDITFLDVSGIGHKFNARYERKDSLVSTLDGNPCDKSLLDDSIRGRTISKLADYIVSSVYKALQNTDALQSHPFVVAVKGVNPNVSVKALLKDDNSGFDMSMQGYVRTLHCDVISDKTGDLQVGALKFSGMQSNDMNAFALLSVDYLENQFNGAFYGAWKMSVDVLADDSETSVKTPKVYVSGNDLVLELIKDCVINININTKECIVRNRISGKSNNFGVVGNYRESVKYKLRYYMTSVNPVFETSKKSESNNLRIVTLRYNNQIVGYRFKGDDILGYDISIDVAEKYGVTKMKSLKVIALESRDGLLVSKSEIRSGKTVDDISDNDKLITKLINKIQMEV